MKNKFINIFLVVIAISMSLFINPEQLFANETISQNIKAIIPNGWEIIESKQNEIPWGHYWGLDYKGKKGELLVLRGPQDVNFEWKDKNEKWHKIPLAKEALEIWIMPPGYHESWKRFFMIHRPVPAEKICDSNSLTLFAQPSHRITDEAKFNELLEQAKTTSWPESPHNRKVISWFTWKNDLAKAICGANK